MYLDDLLKKYTKLLENTQQEIDNYNSQTEPLEKEKIKRSLFDKYTDFEITAFYLLSLSAISGEYIAEDKFEDKLREFSQHKIPENQLGGDFDQYDLVKIIFPIVWAIQLVLAEYLSFYHKIKYTFDKKIEKEIPIINNGLSQTSNEVDKYKSNFILLFKDITLQICLYDFYPQEKSIKYEEELINLYKRVEDLAQRLAYNLELNKLSSILLNKLKFIFYKIGEDNFSYYSDAQILKIDTKNCGELNTFIEYEQLKNVTSDERDSWLNNIRGNIEEIDVKNFILLIYYYRKNKNEIIDFDEVIDLFDDYYYYEKRKTQKIQETLLYTYNSFALDSVKIFLHNCRFSKFISSEGITLNLIKVELDKIESIITETHLFNSFPYKKSIETIFKCIDSHLDNKDINQKLIDTKFTTLNEFMVKYQENLAWCKVHKYLHFFLPFENWPVTVKLNDNESVNIFTPSSFASLIDYEKETKEATEFRLKMDSKKTECVSSLYFEKMSKDAASLETKFKESQRKGYEYLGIFTGLVTFLIGSVGLFSQNKEACYSNTIINTSVFGIFMVLFIGLILITSPFFTYKEDFKFFCKETWNNHWFRILASGIIVGAYIFIIVLFGLKFTVKDTAKDQKNTTINKENAKVTIKRSSFSNDSTIYQVSNK